MRPFRTLAIALLAVSCTCLAAAQTIQINRENKTIAISTTDEATAIADIAAITIGFEIFKPDADSAAAEAGKLSHAIMDALHKAGVDDKSIESKTQDVHRNTNFDDKENAAQRAQRQYRAEQSWEFSVAPKDASAVLQLAMASGANTSGAIDWRLTDRKELQARAAGTALVKARAVAAQMAEGLHVKLGALIFASNELPDAKIYFKRPLGGLAEFNRIELAAKLSTPPPPPPLEIRPQTIREEATVYAVFAIE